MTKLYVENWGMTDAEFNEERGALSSPELDHTFNEIKNDRVAARRELSEARDEIARLETELSQASAELAASRSAGTALFELFRRQVRDMIESDTQILRLRIEELEEANEATDSVTESKVESMIEDALEQFCYNASITISI